MEAVHHNQAYLTAQGRTRLLDEGTTDYAFYMLNCSGMITTWNSGARRCKGYEASEVLGRHFSIFYTDEDRRDDLPARSLAASAAHEGFETEGWRLRKDGSHFWASVVINPIRDQAGELVGFAKVTRDLTARKAGEDALKRSEEQFRILVQGVTDYAIYLLDPQGYVSSWNTGAEKIKGYVPDEIIGKHFSIFYIEDDRRNGEPERALKTAAQAGRFEKEGWRVRKNGDVFWANVVIDPIRNDQGALIGFAKVTRDMTETKRQQLNVERTRDALLQSQKMEAVGQLTGGVAHDFNNLLTAILGGLEIIHRRLPPNGNITPLLENAIQSALRGRALTQRMLAFARRQDLNPEEIDLSALVRGMTDLLERTLGPSIVIETEFPDRITAVMADANQLEMAILNLAMNAREAMPDGGTITIAIAARKAPRGISDVDGREYLCLSVTDDGNGMDVATLSRASEPFFSTKGVGKGTGLGLSMVHGFAEQSGGHLSLRSHLGTGTVAELWLPVKAAPDLPTAQIDCGTDISSRCSHGEPALVVLAVDDDRLSLMNTSSILNEIGCRVFAATSGKQALASIREGRVPDLVVIDHTMPDMSGAELAEAIRTDWPDLPIVFLTPLADPFIHRVPKPFQRDQLAAAIAMIEHRKPMSYPA